jgi:hypothetical protein
VAHTLRNPLAELGPDLIPTAFPDMVLTLMHNGSVAKWPMGQTQPRVLHAMLRCIPHLAADVPVSARQPPACCVGLGALVALP